VNTYEHDYAKRRSSKRRILDLLSDGKPHTMRELNDITTRLELAAVSVPPQVFG
jgi:hypothetical protein